MLHYTFSFLYLSQWRRCWCHWSVYFSFPNSMSSKWLQTWNTNRYCHTITNCNQKLQYLGARRIINRKKWAKSPWSSLNYIYIYTDLVIMNEMSFRES